jgi:uncharacterized protein
MVLEEVNFNRRIIQELRVWTTSDTKKPLVLRGARQVGKTTVVRQFGKEFGQYIELNLELFENKTLFEKEGSFDELVQNIFFLNKKSYLKKEKTLLFIDEIQEVPRAMNLLRYFYELEPTISVIASGSMLETLFDSQMSFPVGRVEYMVLRPVTFTEYLYAMKETAALEVLQQKPVPQFAQEHLFSLFKTFVLIGGMPEIVANYAKNRDLKSLSKIYNSLISSYSDDVEKYAKSSVQTQHIRAIIRNMFGQAGRRIKFEGFGNTNYKSRDMAEGLRTLEKALVLNLLHPTTSTKLPLMPDSKKSPKLQVLDSGLMNYFVGLQSEILGTNNLESVYQGTLIEHFVGQEMMALQFDTLNNLNFWIREKKSSSAEIDYIVNHKSRLIPIEVKSGKIGKLKSLLIYMDDAPHDRAVRVYGGKLVIEKHKTSNGKEFFLLNLPYFLSYDMLSYLDWFDEQVAP